MYARYRNMKISVFLPLLMELCSKGFDEVIRSRTACRKYKDQKVDDKLLDLILSETIVGLVSCSLPSACSNGPQLAAV